MRYLLTSAGITNPTIAAELDRLLPKPIDECNALVIPTAGYWFTEGPDIAHRLITSPTQANLGWKSLGVLELTAIAGLDRSVWEPRVRASDALFVGGGDPQFLCEWMRACGLAELLSDLELVYIGLSAGSMAVTASFGSRYNGRPVPASNSSSPLGVIDCALFVHLDNPDVPGNTRDVAHRWASDIPVPTYLMDDDSALSVSDGQITVVTEGVCDRLD